MGDIDWGVRRMYMRGIAYSGSVPALDNHDTILGSTANGPDEYTKSAQVYTGTFLPARGDHTNGIKIKINEGYDAYLTILGYTNF